MYLKRRSNGIYYFRIRHKINELSISLDTNYRTKALFIARYIKISFDKICFMAIDIKQLRQLLKQYKQQALEEYSEMEERRHRFVTNGYFSEMGGGGYMVNFADEPHRPLYAGLFKEIKYLSSVLNTKFDERRL